jgi:hypothetical protein
MQTDYVKNVCGNRPYWTNSYSKHFSVETWFRDKQSVTRESLQGNYTYHCYATTETRVSMEVVQQNKTTNGRAYPSKYNPCGGGVEYLHRDPASRRRRRKGKSRIWDNKIWPRVLWDSDPRMTALAKASSNCKRQTRPLVRESAPLQQTRNYPTVIKISS